MSGTQLPGSLSPSSIANRGDFSPQAVIQITPIRKHATSNYRYYAEILEPYAITEADWHAFTQQFVNANTPTRNQVVTLKCITLFLYVFYAVLSGSVGLALGPTLVSSFITGPVYYYVKRNRLRHHVENGDIAHWLLVWNMQYFIPKGLIIGFDLPGRLLPYAAVAPKTRNLTRIRGAYKKPKSAWGAHRRARVIVARLHDPVPKAGSRPDLRPIAISRIYEDTERFKNRAALWFVTKMNEATYRAAQDLALQRSETQRAVEQVKWRKLRAVKHATRDFLLGRHIEIDPVTFVVTQGRKEASPGKVRPHVGSARASHIIESLDGHSSSPAPIVPTPKRDSLRRVFKKQRKEQKEQVSLLGGSRIDDASRCFL